MSEFEVEFETSEIPPKFDKQYTKQKQYTLILQQLVVVKVITRTI